MVRGQRGETDEVRYWLKLPRRRNGSSSGEKDSKLAAKYPSEEGGMSEDG